MPPTCWTLQLAVQRPSLIAGNRNRNRPVFTRLYPTRTTTRTCRSGKRNFSHPCERWPNFHLPILPSPRIIVSSPRPILMHRCFTPPTRARSSSAPASGNAPTPPPFEKPLVHSALWPRFQPFMLDLSERLRCFHWSSAITASLDSSKIHRLSLCLTTMTGAPLSGGGHHGHHARELISLGPRPTPSRLIFSSS